ncbi:hypothetical protein CK934_20470 [Chitinophaga sp. MD30]|nr:hypothetical protein CK934_20470 [Chitinophaga sp. MD30]
MLLVLKTGGVLFHLFPEKHRVQIDISTDTEDNENEESTETDKLICLLLTDTHTISSLSEQDKAPMHNTYCCNYTTDHFDTIPSPPPDNSMI